MHKVVACFASSTLRTQGYSTIKCYGKELLCLERNQTWRSIESVRLITTSDNRISQVDKYLVDKFTASPEGGPSFTLEGHDVILASKHALFEDHLFDLLKDEKDTVSVNKYFSLLLSSGLRQNDPRLRESTQKLLAYQRAMLGLDGNVRGEVVSLDRETFKSCILENIMVVARAFKSQFVIPEFTDFCKHINDIYWNCRSNTKGKVADYIPQLSRFSADYWGVSVCTVDGQRYSLGDTEVPICLQSCSKPLTYALALRECGQQVIHQYVGQEPSGRSFNEIKLNPQCKPHNPMINSGAITVSSLLRNDLKLSDRFDWVNKEFSRLAGGEFVGFSNATFLSERETADRNFALGYYLKENKCFPEGTNITEVLDFYFQACSIEVNCDSGSVIAASLANGGICPITGDRILDEESVQNTLSLMHSCGMYDYSGQFAFKVGLPSKSGVSGAILLVVPNTMGICLWSPPLDETGNSCRGIQFCEELVQKFNFHNYDILQKFTNTKIDPRRRELDSKGSEVVSLLFGAFNGDLSAMRRFFLKGVNMGQGDYDQRTALHLAAAEGHVEVVRFLLEKCKVDPRPKDRWGHTPLAEAQRFEHQAVAELLETYEVKEEIPVREEGPVLED